MQVSRENETIALMKVVAVIPARLASTRLSRKMLREIAGLPLIVRVYKAVQSCTLLSETIVATDSDEILRTCLDYGCNVRMTSSAHRSGTERVHEISNAIQADCYLNVQGDEPLTRSEHISALVELMADSKIEVGTLKTPSQKGEALNPSVVKVVTDSGGKALYFSRAPIPHDRDGAGCDYYKHLGFYAYRKPVLDRFVLLSEGYLERCEKLEQLRFLENAISIHVKETPYDTVGVDTEDDLRAVEEILRH